MRKLNGGVFLSLDGVMQAPGGPTEDPTGGFKHGGWMQPLDDDAVGEVIGGLFTAPYALLLGRFTYDIFAAYWPYAGDGPEAGFAASLNAAEKYVLTHRSDGLDWENTHRLADVADVAALKASDGPDLLIQGSGTLYPQLLEAGLIDRIVTLTFPLVLGKGKRLFTDATPTLALRMTDHRVTASGIVIATYEPAGPIATGSFALPEPSEREKARQARMQAADPA